MVPIPGGLQWNLGVFKPVDPNHFDGSQTRICIKIKDRIRNHHNVKSRIRSRTKVKSRIRERINVTGIRNTGIRDRIWIRFRIQSLPKKVTASTEFKTLVIIVDNIFWIKIYHWRYLIQVGLLTEVDISVEGIQLPLAPVYQHLLQVTGQACSENTYLCKKMHMICLKGQQKRYKSLYLY